MSEPLKQVIVMRHDLSMRRGKQIAQGAHSSSMCLVQPALLRMGPSKEILRWLQEGMTKICVRVDSEQELMDIAKSATVAGLIVHVITDAGHTEFHGVPTRTCLAIGPNKISKVDAVTGHLKLL